MSDQVLVDVNALTSFLRENFKQLHSVSKERCIYRVPKQLRVLNEKAYTPKCVSIGPYHHGKDELKAMEEEKKMYLQHFLGYSKVSLDELVSCVRDNETKLRNCYEDKIELSSERFVRLVLVDAAFVIILMSRGLSMDFDNEEELLLNKPWMKMDIATDLILLENQLPFFILHELALLSNLEAEMSKFSEYKHLVDLARIVEQPLEQNKHKALDALNLPNVLDLHLAGVKFKRGSSERLADIKFHDGILEIPVLKIADHTEILFRNILAFEQTHLYRGERYFSDYISIISFLITNGKDVEILTKEGIIENWLRGDDQVVHLFRNICKEIFVDPKKFYFSDVFSDITEYCSKRRNRWRASLIQNYFSSPWSIISVSAAAAIILLTIIQTICSILQVKQQQP